MNEKTKAAEKISIDKIKELMAIILPIPRWWLFGIATVFVFSSFEIKRTDSGLFAGSFRISGVGLALLALVWLPVLLKLIGLTGIGLKTSGVEASTGGLLELLKALDPSAQRETLPSVIAALEVAEAENVTAAKPAAQELKRELQNQLASLPVLPKGVAQAREELEKYAREYEQLRRDMSSGSARTIRMTALVSRMMALANQCQFKPEELKELFDKGNEGDRLAAIAMAAASADPRNFDVVAKGISPARSAFEQFQALRAAAEMLPGLNPEQRSQLKQLLLYERSGAAGTRINEKDLSRWSLSGRLLTALGERI